MIIETIKIAPKDNIRKKLDEAKEKSVLNNMPVLIKLIGLDGKSRKKDKAYLVSRDFSAKVIERIYQQTSSSSASFSDDNCVEERSNSNYNRLKNIINRLYENSFGGETSTASISNPKIVNVEIELFPAIDSKTSLAETIYLDRSGQLGDLSLEEQIFLDAGLYNYLQLIQTTYEIERKPKVLTQLDEYKCAKNGKSSLERIGLIESNLRTNPMYKEKHFEKLAGRYKGLLSRRINGKDRYVYGVLRDQYKLIVHSVRGHYD